MRILLVLSILLFPAMPASGQSADSARLLHFLKIIHTDSARKDYLSAINHFSKYLRLKDSMLNAAGKMQVKQMEQQFQTAQKDNEIISREKNIGLLTGQNKLSEINLRQARSIRGMVIAVAVIAALLLIISYFRFRLKKRANLRLEHQQNAINQKNENLQQLAQQKDSLLEDKEMLIKEIHHRVKNNLQVVISLLNTQSAYLNNEQASAAIRQSQHRMQSRSLIHQKLYQSENVAFINMAAYIHELTDYLSESYDTGHAIHFDLNAEEIELDVAQAVPVGLILNEAITNAIKYAFPDEHKGTITIAMQSIPGNNLLLGINDNGIGLPETFDTGKNNSFGMSLMQGLAKQLEGTLQIKSDKGLSIRIEFPYNKIMKPVPEKGILYKTPGTSV